MRNELRRKEVLSATIIQIFTAILLTTFSAYLGLHLENLFTAALIIALIFSSQNFIQLFLRIPLAELSQIKGRKPLLISGLIFFTLSYLFLYFATSWHLVLFATLSLGIGMSLYWPSMFAYIGDISDNNYGKINGIIFQGSDIGVIIGTFIIQELFKRNLIDLYSLFLLTFATGVIAIIVALIILPEVLENEHRKESSRVINDLANSFKQSIINLKKISRVRPLYFIYGFQYIISYGEYFVNVFLSLLLVTGYGYDYDDVARLILFRTLVIFFFKPYLGKISDKYGFRIPIIFSLLINSLVLLSFTFTSNFIILIGLSIIFTSASFTSYIAVNGGTSKYASPSNRGLAMGALGFYVSFGRASSSLLVTPFWENLQNSLGDSLAILWLFRISSLIVFIGVITMGILSRNLNKNIK